MMCSECRNFEMKLANHSAPSLLGVKCANLISLNKHEFNVEEQLERFNSKAVNKGLKIEQLCSCENHVLIFLYNEKMLGDRLALAENRKILSSYGYAEDMSLGDCLKRLSERYGGQLHCLYILRLMHDRGCFSRQINAGFFHQPKLFKRLI